MSTKIKGHEGVSYASAKEDSKKIGKLKKYGGSGITANWKLRYFVLTSQYLYYFKGEKDSQPRGVVDLINYSNVEAADDKKKLHCFRVLSKDMANLRIFYVQCKDETEYNQWMDAIQQVIQSLREARLRKSFLNTATVIRPVRTLTVRVAEARNLMCKDLGGGSDPYCILQMGSQNFQTQTIWKNKSPFWGEEYVLIVEDPKKDVLSVSVFDEDRVTKDDPIGKLSFPVKDFVDQVAREQWWHLIPQNYEHFVSGDIRLKIQYSPFKGEQHHGSLKITVVEARNLASKDANGFSDPYVKLVFAGEKKKTQIIKKTLNPVFNEEFEYKITSADHKELIVQVFDWDRLSSNEFMGQLSIPLDTLFPHTVHDGWYTLGDNLEEDTEESAPGESKPAEKEEEKKKEGPLGEIRLKIRYNEEIVLPAKEYAGLWKLLSEDKFGTVTLLGEVTPDREEVAKALVRLFHSKGLGLEMLNSLTAHEIENTTSADVIFRGNSIATKSLDYFMKLIGLKYLHKTIGGLISEIVKQKKSCEIDPLKMEKGENVEKNLAQLVEHVTSFFDAIVNSIDDCPVELRDVFCSLQTKCRTKWGDDHITRYTAVSGFIFLRFWGPAILGPKLFGITRDHPDKVSTRTLTLIAKVLQNLGNLVEFGAKEPFMKDMNQFIVDNIPKIKSFIDQLSAVPAPKPEPSKIDVIDEGRELASIFTHLKKNMPNILSHESSQKLTDTKRLQDVVTSLSEVYAKYGIKT